VSRFVLCFAICLWGIAHPNPLLAAQWPKWPTIKSLKKKPDIVTAACKLENDHVELGSKDLLRAKMDASDSLGHDLSYVWNGNGGKILGVGAEVKVDASGLNPGVYGLVAKTQDAYKNSAQCSIEFRVLPPADRVLMSCSVESPVVEQGHDAHIQAQATDGLGHELKYLWFTNGGTLKGDGPRVALDTAGLAAGDYTVTGRVEDDSGLASDCAATVQVKLATPPPPPPVPPTPSNIAQIVFAPNRDSWESRALAQLQRVLLRLQKEPDGRISIEAYAGPEETKPSELANRRAEAVKRYLVQNGVPESRLQTLVGLGGKRGGLRNRMLDVIWLPKDLEY